MIDNKERIALNLIKEAHRFNGLFKNSYNKGYGIWLAMIFESTDDQGKFNEFVHVNNMCKCMKLGEKGSNLTYLMI